MTINLNSRINKNASLFAEDYCHKLVTNFHVYVLASAVDCGPPPAVLHASTSTPVRTTYLSDVTYTCLPGHFFHRNVFDKTVTCQADGVWSDVDACVRKFTRLFCGNSDSVAIV